MHRALADLATEHFGGTLPVREVAVARYALDAAIARWKEEVDHGLKVAVVSDPNTFALAGRRLCTALRAWNWCFDAPPRASLAVAEELAAKAVAVDLLIAVGSGTINDLCKYASFRAGKPYRVVATAPSMNGYVSANASLLADGAKSSFAAHLPEALVADLDLLCAAPAELIAAGAGDSLCLPTVRADWHLARLLADAPCNPAALAMQEPLWQAFFADPRALAARDRGAVEGLMLLLIASGLAMFHAGGSEPASQGEHMIAHTVEMLYPDWSQRLYHGQWIALTTGMMAEHQRQLLAAPAITLREPPHEAMLEAYFGPGAGAACARAVTQKRVLHGVIRERLAGWGAVREELAASAVSPDALRRFAETAGILPDRRPYAEMLDSAIRLAPWTRNRLTFLDFSLP